MSERNKLIVLIVLVVVLIIVAAVTFLRPRPKVLSVPKPSAMLTEGAAVPERHFSLLSQALR